MGHLLMTEPHGRLIATDADLPSKGEEMIAGFGYVREVLMCTN
jgi:hypothetical protein